MQYKGSLTLLPSSDGVSVESAVIYVHEEPDRRDP